MVGRAEIQNKPVPHPTWQLKIRKVISAVEVPPEEQGISIPLPNPQSRILVTGREVSITSGYGKPVGLWLSEKATEVQGAVVFLKAKAQTYSNSFSLSSSTRPAF